MLAVVIIVRTCVDVWWAPMHVCAAAVPYWCCAYQGCRQQYVYCNFSPCHAFVSDDAH